SDAPRPRLTAENNPVAALEKELPQYYRRIQEKEDLLDGVGAKDYEKRSDIYDQQKAIKEDFTLKLLNWWHGTAAQPGISRFTDAELATSNVSEERVAQIRKALTLSAKSQHRATSPLTQSLADLARYDIHGNEDSFGLLGQIEVAKAKFFNYDESELSQ